VDTALGVQSGVGNFGVILALGTSGFLGEAFGWKAPCLVWAGLNLSAVVAGLLLIRGHDVKVSPTVPVRRATPRETLSKMWILIIPIITGGALYQVTSYFGPTNLTTSAEWDASSADLIFAVWIGVGTVTSYYFGAMSYRFGKQRLLSAGYLVSAISVLFLAFFVEWFVVAPVLVLFGAFLMLTYPALFSFVNQATVEGERGTAFGILFGFQLGGGACVVYLCGIVADAFGDASYAFLVVAGLSLASFVSVRGRRATGTQPSRGLL
jgi:predicted MFS family arabinose efflux permease